MSFLHPGPSSQDKRAYTSHRKEGCAHRQVISMHSMPLPAPRPRNTVRVVFHLHTRPAVSHRGKASMALCIYCVRVGTSLNTEAGGEVVVCVDGVRNDRKTVAIANPNGGRHPETTTCGRMMALRTRTLSFEDGQRPRRSAIIDACLR